MINNGIVVKYFHYMITEITKNRLNFFNYSTFFLELYLLTIKQFHFNYRNIFVSQYPFILYCTNCSLERMGLYEKTASAPYNFFLVLNEAKNNVGNICIWRTKLKDRRGLLDIGIIERVYVVKWINYHNKRSFTRFAL